MARRSIPFGDTKTSTRAGSCPWLRRSRTRASTRRQQSAALQFQTHLRALAARFASELLQSSPSKSRGRREGRVLAAPMARLQTKSRRRHHRFSQNIRPSLRDGFNGVLRALPGDRAFLPPSPRRSSSAKLGASVGAPGPHDFSVRDLDDRLTRGRVHRIPQPTFVTIAKRPSARPQDAGKGARDLPDVASAIGCGMLARRANRASYPCANCPSGRIGRAR
jgi:hypothetical protein